MRLVPDGDVLGDGGKGGCRKAALPCVCASACGRLMEGSKSVGEGGCSPMAPKL